MPIFRIALVALAAVLLLAGCDDGARSADVDDQDRSAPEPVEEEPGDLAERCENPQGFSVAYPENWVANEEPDDAFEDEYPACSLFDPVSVEFDDAVEVPVLIAISMIVEPADFDPATGVEPVAEEVSEEELTIAGHDAVRRELVAQGGGVFPLGTPFTVYHVEIDDRLLRAQTVGAEIEGGLDYETKQQVLEEMLESLELEEDEEAGS